MESVFGARTMLNETVVQYMTSQTYRPDAIRKVCWIPVGGIYWEDEIPDMKELYTLGSDARNQVFRLLGIRQKIWAGLELTEDDQQFWDSAYQQVPTYPLFHRLPLSDKNREAQRQAEQDTLDCCDALFSDADKLEVNRTQPGLEKETGTYDLTRQTNNPRSEKPWWKRLKTLFE